MGAEEEEAVIRANDGTYFVVIESSVEPQKTYTTTETFTSVKDLFKWVIDELDYYVSNDTVKEIDEITRTGGIAVLDLSIGSITVARASNRDAALNLPLKKEDDKK
jgi:hypothetical protein